MNKQDEDDRMVMRQVYVMAIFCAAIIAKVPISTQEAVRAADGLIKALEE